MDSRCRSRVTRCKKSTRPKPSQKKSQFKKKRPNAENTAQNKKSGKIYTYKQSLM